MDMDQKTAVKPRSGRAYEVRLNLSKILSPEELRDFSLAARAAGRTLADHLVEVCFAPPPPPVARRASRPVASPHPTSASRRAGRKTKA